jgi:Holliday junction resolvasome RuvABC endonuclease subunit
VRAFAVGIDPSLTGTAIAWLGVSTIRKGEGDARLLAIHKAVSESVSVQRFESFAVVEDLPYNARSAGATGLAHGVVRLALQQAKVPYILIPPATLKAYATGKGNATKADMRMAWFKRTGEDIRDDNQVDALWLRDIGRFAVGDQLALKLPRAQRERLFKLEWPPDIAARLLEPYERAVQEVAP